MASLPLRAANKACGGMYLGKGTNSATKELCLGDYHSRSTVVVLISNIFRGYSIFHELFVVTVHCLTDYLSWSDAVKHCSKKGPNPPVTDQSYSKSMSIPLLCSTKGSNQTVKHTSIKCRSVLICLIPRSCDSSQRSVQPARFVLWKPTDTRQSECIIWLALSREGAQKWKLLSIPFSATP